MNDRPPTHAVPLRVRGARRKVRGAVGALALSFAGCSVYGPWLIPSGREGLLNDSDAATASDAGQETGVADSDADVGGGPETGTGGGASSTGGTAAESGGMSPVGDTEGGASELGGASGAAGVSGTGSAGGAPNAAGAGGAGMALAGSTGSAGAASQELAHGKPCTSSSQEKGDPRTNGNDGNSSTLWCASDGTFPQWWRVDLGASHVLNDFSVTWEKPDRKYSYKIETSSNDSVYTLGASLSGTGTVQSGTFPTPIAARYVRITVTGATPGVYTSGTYPTWSCFFEFAVHGT